MTTQYNINQHNKMKQKITEMYSLQQNNNKMLQNDKTIYHLNQYTVYKK